MDNIKWDFEEINQLINAVRIIHFNHLSIGLALGIKGSLKALFQLNNKRNKNELIKAEVLGSFCFGQAVEQITGCCVMKKTMIFNHTKEPKNYIKLWTKNNLIELNYIEREYASYKEVFLAKDDEIFSNISIMSTN